MLERLIESAPEMKMPVSYLDLVASWLIEENRPIPYRELIATRMADVAQRLGIDPIISDIEIHTAEELSEEELVEVACQQIREGRKDVVLVKGNQEFDMGQLEREIRQMTPAGLNHLRTTRQGLSFQEALLKAGKIVVEPSMPENLAGVILPELH